MTSTPNDPHRHDADQPDDQARGPYHHAPDPVPPPPGQARPAETQGFAPPPGTRAPGASTPGMPQGHQQAWGHPAAGSHPHSHVQPAGLPPKQREHLAREAARREAGGVGISAALLLFFGFFMFRGNPDPTDLFLTGDLLFRWTLRIGGIGLGLAALALMNGDPRALLADAIVTGITGLGLILSGGMMLLGGGMMAILYLIIGAVFVGNARRAFRQYTMFTNPRVPVHAGAGYAGGSAYPDGSGYPGDPGFAGEPGFESGAEYAGGPAYEHPAATPPAASSGHPASAPPAAPPSPVQSAPPPAPRFAVDAPSLEDYESSASPLAASTPSAQDEPYVPDESPTEDEPQPSSTDDTPPPGGFLASFGKEEDEGDKPDR
jgi:hypothetical protein